MSSVFQSVSSHIEDIRATTSRDSILQSLDAIGELMKGHKSLSSVTKTVRKLSESTVNREIKRKKILKTLRKRVLPEVESMTSQSAGVPENVVVVIERSLAKSNIVKHGDADIRREDLYLTDNEFNASPKLSPAKFLQTPEDLSMYRKFMGAPVRHAQLGIDIIASIANNFSTENKKKILNKLIVKYKVKPYVFADDAVSLAYATLVGDPSLTWTQIVKSPAIHVNDYAKSFFSTKDFSANIKVRAKYKSMAELSKALRQLIMSLSNIRDYAKISARVQKRYNEAYISRSLRYRVSVADATAGVAELLKDQVAAENQGSVREQYMKKFARKLPKSFSEASVFTIRNLPVEVKMKGSLLLNDPETMSQFGIKVTTAQVDKLRKGASVFYEDQPLLIFDRALLKDMVLAEIEETATATLARDKARVADTNTELSKLRKVLKALLAARPNATAKKGKEIDTQVTRVNTQIKKTESQLETVKKERAASKKSIDTRVKYLAANEGELLETGLRFIIEHVNSRSSTEFTLVSSLYQTNPKSPNSSMAWIMPVSVFGAMEGAMGNVTIDSWNLPWGKDTGKSAAQRDAESEAKSKLAKEVAAARKAGLIK